MQVATVGGIIDLEVSQLLKQGSEQIYDYQTIVETNLNSTAKRPKILYFYAINAMIIAVQKELFALIDGALHFIDQKNNHCDRCVVPKQLRTQLI